jgi:aminopeptidase N
MLYMTSGGAVVHETMHMVAHGVLANNEWREGWLDEGLASFLSNWFREARGEDPGRVWGRTEQLVAALEQRGLAEPVGLPAAEFSSFDLYQVMTYFKGALLFRALRDELGEDAFRAGLREYYQRFRFRQVTGHDFRAVMELVSGRDLGPFFQRWLRSS